MNRAVIRARHRRPGLARRLFPALALLALAVRILVPQGFMVASAEAPSAFPLVICTSQGVIQAGPLAPLHKAPDGKTSAHDAPCAFAGHTPAPAPDLFTAERVSFAADHAAPSTPVRRDLAPGRGLTAPPLPARGPPQLIL
jgi:hypothetical protein